MIFPEQLDAEDMDLFAKEARLAGYDVRAEETWRGALTYMIITGRDGSRVPYFLHEEGWIRTTLAHIQDRIRTAWTGREGQAWQTKK